MEQGEVRGQGAEEECSACGNSGCRAEPERHWQAVWERGLSNDPPWLCDSASKPHCSQMGLVKTARSGTDFSASA